MCSLRYLHCWPVHFQRGVEQVSEDAAGVSEATREALHEVYDIGVAENTDGFCAIDGRVRPGNSGRALPQPSLYISAGFPCRQILVYDTDGGHVAEVELTLHSTAHIAGVMSESPALLRRYHIGRLRIVGRRLLVSDCQYDCVYLCNLDGNVDLVVGSHTGAKLNTPMGLDAADNLLVVCDSGNRRLQAFDLDGRSASLPNVRFSGRVRCACLLPRQNQLCIADFESANLHLYDLAGSGAPKIVRAEQLDQPSLLKEPFCCLPAPQPNTVLVSYSGIQGDHSVRLIDLEECRVLAKVGGRGDQAGQFNKPRGMAIDPQTNRLFVVDARNFRVQVFQL